VSGEDAPGTAAAARGTAAGAGAPDLLTGPLLPAILKIAGPVLALEAMHVGYHLINLFWVGRLGAAATAALTTSLFATWIMGSLAEAVAIGIVAQVARAIGEERADRAGHAAAQGVLAAFALGLMFLFFARPFTGPLFRLLDMPPDVAPLAATYLGTVFAGAPAFFLLVAAESIWRATGDTVTPLRVLGASTLLNAVLDPLLIFGLRPFPALGVAGAAWATIIAWSLGVLLFAALARGAGDRFPLARSSLARADWATIARTLRIGLPRFLIGTLFSAVYLLLANLAARFGTAAIAVLGIVNRLESMSYIMADAVGAATSTLVGQNLGAAQPERASRAANTAVRLGVAISLVPTAAMLLVPRLLLRPFTADLQVLDLGEPYLRVIGLCQAFMVLELVFAGGFAGAGDTVPPMLVELPIAAARVPLCWFAAVTLGMGPLGIAWVLSLTAIIRGILIWLWFRTGRWQRRRLWDDGTA
jgi:putative MATE family efflux protein